MSSIHVVIHGACSELYRVLRCLYHVTCVSAPRNPMLVNILSPSGRCVEGLFVYHPELTSTNSNGDNIETAKSAYRKKRHLTYTLLRHKSRTYRLIVTGIYYELVSRGGK
jgi:hypothetical protein